MPPPYTADKRIRDLNLQITPLLNDVLAMDRNGSLEATKITIQMLVDIVSPNVTKQTAYADVVAPDNALGINGDFAFRIPADGSAIQMYQKISGAWSSVFNLPINPITTYNQTDLLLDGTSGSYYIPSTDTRKLLYVESNDIQLNGAYLDTSFTPNRIYGFLGNYTQTIKIKRG